MLLSQNFGQLICHFRHVKGHSDDPGNERVDKLVQWGKGKGPTQQHFKTLDVDGGYEEPASTMDTTHSPPAISLEYDQRQLDPSR